MGEQIFPEQILPEITLSQALFPHLLNLLFEHIIKFKLWILVTDVDDDLINVHITIKLITFNISTLLFSGLRVYQTTITIITHFLIIFSAVTSYCTLLLCASVDNLGGNLDRSCYQTEVLPPTIWNNNQRGVLLPWNPIPGIENVEE